ncbi:hypothetical protein BH18ACT4_BH18ACT4_08470 [soil metagenome]
MGLSRVLDAMSAYLAAELAPDGPAIGALPAAADDLPVVVLSVGAVTQQVSAIGRIPAPSRRGALPVSQDFDLADPAVTFPDGERVNLLAPDRRSLHFPYGPVVAADGTGVPALTGSDLVVTVTGAPLDVVAGDPDAGEVVGDPALGEVSFGAPLPPTGTLHLEFFLGEWSVETYRFQGELLVQVATATPGETDALSRRVEDALRAVNPMRVPGWYRADPISLGPILVGAGSLPAARSRALDYRFDFELEEPLLGTGGGLIGTVAVDSSVEVVPGPTLFLEHFDVVSEGSVP